MKHFFLLIFAMTFGICVSAQTKVEVKPTKVPVKSTTKIKPAPEKQKVYSSEQAPHQTSITKQSAKSQSEVKTNSQPVPVSSAKPVTKERQVQSSESAKKESVNNRVIQEKHQMKRAPGQMKKQAVPVKEIPSKKE